MMNLPFGFTPDHDRVAFDRAELGIILSLYGRELGLRVARKHLGWYAEANGAPNRAELLRAPTPEAALAAIRAGFGDAAPVFSPATEVPS